MRQILTRQFRFNDGGDPARRLPTDRRGFYGVVPDSGGLPRVADLDSAATASFVAIYGQVAGPYRDPTLGRDPRASGRGDLLIQDPQPNGPTAPLKKLSGSKGLGLSAQPLVD